MEQIEKHIYNAYEGNAGGITQPSAVSVSFFQQNRKVCTDWFARLRKHRLATALNAGIESHSFKQLSQVIFFPLRPSLHIRV